MIFRFRQFYTRLYVIWIKPILSNGRRQYDRSWYWRNTDWSNIISNIISNNKEKKGVFRKEWLSVDQYSSWLQAIDYDSTKARCKACLKTFSVHSDGKSALDKHLISYALKKSMESLNKNCSVPQFITLERELDKISAAECVLVFHGVKHGHNYHYVFY